jgi:hypothetical protein
MTLDLPDDRQAMYRLLTVFRNDPSALPDHVALGQLSVVYALVFVIAHFFILTFFHISSPQISFFTKE